MTESQSLVAERQWKRMRDFSECDIDAFWLWFWFHVYTYVKAYLIIHLKYVQLIVHKVFYNKILKKINLKEKITYIPCVSLWISWIERKHQEKTIHFCANACTKRLWWEVFMKIHFFAHVRCIIPHSHDGCSIPKMFFTVKWITP